MAKKITFKILALAFAFMLFVSAFVAGIVLGTSKVVAINTLDISQSLDGINTLDDTIVVSGTTAAELKPNIDSEQGNFGFSYSLPSNAEIIKVYQSPIGSDVKSIYTDYDKQHISLYYEKNGSAKFQIFVRVNNFAAQEGENEHPQFEEFDFSVTIGGGLPAISSNVELGGHTTKKLTLSFNPYQIYLQHGACNIVVSGRDSGTSGGGVYAINKDSEDSLKKRDFTLDDGVFNIQLVGANKSVFYWASVSYSTPLNVTAVILIVVGVIGGGIIITAFILLRTRMKVR